MAKGPFELRGFARGGSRGHGQGHRHAPQELAQDGGGHSRGGDGEECTEDETAGVPSVHRCCP